MFRKLKEKVRRDRKDDASEGQAPPGPPPAYDNLPIYDHSKLNYIPSSFPQQPPPSWDPPPYHDWTVIPDTALLPPPPSIGYDSSPTANATAAEGDQGLAWTKAHPLWPTLNLSPALYDAAQAGQFALLKAPTYIGDLLPQAKPGHWRCRTHAECKDATILTNLPMYSRLWDGDSRPTTIYFELKINGIGRGTSSPGEADAGIAIGFVAPPYPTFRLPGWERGSLAVHGDDGHRYVNDPWGGFPFTTPFKPGETVGIGIQFSRPHGSPTTANEPNWVFFTRNGRQVARWDLEEELDGKRHEGGIVGLTGDYDLYPAVGVFGGVDFEIFFQKSQWLYKLRNPGT